MLYMIWKGSVGESVRNSLSPAILRQARSLWTARSGGPFHLKYFYSTLDLSRIEHPWPPQSPSAKDYLDRLILHNLQVLTKAVFSSSTFPWG